jgi:hypothetical protein
MTQSDDGDTLYGDDTGHVIPFLESLDVLAELKGGGARLHIIAAAPIGGDVRTQKRLIRKIENYLRYINSDHFEANYSPASRTNTTIELDIKQNSAPEIHDLLERCRDWVDEHNAKLIVRKV